MERYDKIVTYTETDVEKLDCDKIADCTHHALADWLSMISALDFDFVLSIDYYDYDGEFELSVLRREVETGEEVERRKEFDKIRHKAYIAEMARAKERFEERLADAVDNDEKFGSF